MLRHLIALTLVAGFALADTPSKACSTENYQGNRLSGDSCPVALTIPARTLVQGRCYNQMVDLSLDVSFLYWYGSQDGMTLATSAAPQTTTAVTQTVGASTLSQHFEYKPGFKLGIGAGYQDGEIHLEYMWIRQHTALDSDAPAPGSAGTGVWFLNDWFAQGVGANNNFIPATNVTSHWGLGIDQIDLTTNRPYYLSKKITVNPSGGLRAIWIRQSLVVGATVPGGALSIPQSPVVSQPVYSHNHSNGWLLGPVMGGTANCLLGRGFRLEGRGDVSLLFAQYTTLYHSEDAASSKAPLSGFSVEKKNTNGVRPTASAGLGLGWGSYFYKTRFHADFSADYDFNILWDQNMMRSFVDEYASGVSSYGDLFLQGLTLKGRFDF